MSIELGNTFSLSTEDMINNSRPAIDVTLSSAAYVYKNRLVGILLSGANKDGALGMKKIKERGGLTIIQNPEECMIATMPEAAKAITEIDHELDIQTIITYLKGLNKYIKDLKV
jgi:two-component system chemotaxis response regulator CheB